MASQTQLVPRISVATSPVAILESPFPESPFPENPGRDKAPTGNFDMQAALLLAAIENFTVGLIIAAPDGTILHQNKQAQALLEQQLAAPSSTTVPESLWKCCHSLLKNQADHGELFPEGYKIVLEDELSTKYGTIQIRAQWFDWDNSAYQSTDCFLITLENRQQSLTAMANQEAQRYGLTSRETDVWQLKRMGQSYKEIAKALFISENTVKKHLKNIYAKKEQCEMPI